MEQRHQLASMLENQTPASMGFEARYTWTLPLVAWIRRRFGVTMSVRGISAMLKRMNFSFTKANYTLAKADENAQALFRKQTFARLKKQVKDEEIDHLLFEDESMIRSYQALQFSWFPCGRQRKIPTYGKHEGAKFFGAINYETGQAHHREEEEDVAAWIRFLEDLLAAYPSGKIAIVLNNSRIHHAEELKPFLKKHPRLHLVFLPPYCPHLVPMERLWLWPKADVVNNVFFEKFYRIKLHISQFIKRIPKDRLNVIARNRKISEYAKELLSAQSSLSKSNFIVAATKFLSISIEESLESNDILLNILVLVDRRVGKKRILNMTEQMKLKHPSVQYFYEMRLSTLTECIPAQRLVLVRQPNL